MLYKVMKHIRNFFHVRGAEKTGLFKIKDGTIVLPFLINGQYFQIEGSILNDGVYKYPASGMKDEEFVGCIAPMAVPDDFIDIVDKITEWVEKHPQKDVGAFQSESFDGYSYTRATNSDGTVAGWTSVFGTELSAWRKR